ncbi:MAG: hypothetical protein Sw2PiBPW_39840 [Shewanella algae]
MLLAASVFGAPEHAIITWRTTDNGLEGIAVKHNDNLLMLDELGQVDGHKAGDIAYMLANTRSMRDGTSRAPQQWNLLFLSNGEIDLATHMRASGKKAMAGQEVRMLTIPADAKQGFGIFESLHGEADGERMARNVKEAVSLYHGTAFAPFTEYIAKHWDDIIADGQRAVAEFIKAHTHEGYDGQVIRAAERFGLIAFAGELASKANITCWSAGHAKQAALECFLAWISHRGGSGKAEESEIVRVLVETLVKHSARFESLETAHLKEQSKISDRLGFISGGEYYIPTSSFREIMSHFNPMYAAEILQKQGIIKHPIGSELPRPSLPGVGRLRCYIISCTDLPDVL